MTAAGRGGGGGGRGRLDARLAALSGMAGYEKPEPPGGGDGGSLKMDSNENTVVPRQVQDDLLSAARRASDVREYPLGGAERLSAAIARHLRVPAASVGVGSGSDQILDLLLACFASARTPVLTTDPTFSFFVDRCRLRRVPVRSVPFSDGMTLDAADVEAASGGAGILYMDTPNNPTGFQMPRRDMERLVRGFDGLVILDEAYAEFGGYTAMPWVRRTDNLVVVRTFSKSFGLAGLRLGYCAAGGGIAEAFNRVGQYPYPVSSLAVEAGILALEKGALEQVRRSVGIVKAERRRIIAGLRAHGAFEVFDSSANFVLFDAGAGADRRVHAALAEQGIHVRRLGRIGRRGGCLRVTVGTREANSRFLLAVRDLLG